MRAVSPRNTSACGPTDFFSPPEILAVPKFELQISDRSPLFPQSVETTALDTAIVTSSPSCVSVRASGCTISSGPVLA